MKSIGSWSTTLAISAILGALLLVMVPTIAEAPPEHNVQFDRPPLNATSIDLWGLLPLSPEAESALSSGRGKFDAFLLIKDYKKASRLPPEANVDVCQVIKGAKSWAPTAATTYIPTYVAVSLALSPEATQKCASIFSGTVPIDSAKARALLADYGKSEVYALSSPTHPGYEFASFRMQARAETYPKALSIGRPEAFYVKALLAIENVSPQYLVGDPDLYLFVDLAFTFHDIQPWTYQTAAFLVTASATTGEVISHAMMPANLMTNEGKTNVTYEIDANGSVNRVIGAAGKYTWQRTYENVVPVVESFGLREPDFYWQFLRSEDYQLIGSKNISVLLRLPSKSRGQNVKLVLNAKAQAAYYIYTMNLQPAAGPACFVIHLVTPVPETSLCPASKGYSQ